MKNWAGNFKFHPQQIYAPSSTEDAQNFVKQALHTNCSIRVSGSSHSWTPLIATNQIQMHLDHLQGICDIDSINHLVKIKAGTTIAQFGEESFKHKLALPNQGDIDCQTMAGAVSTGTHGTGLTLQSISNQIQSLTLITGTGEIVVLDAHQNADLLNAIAVSFGSVGIITEMTLKMVPAYKLKVDIQSEDMHTALSHVQSRLQENRHLEMFYFPVGDWCLVKKMNRTEENVSSFIKFHKIADLVIENWLYECVHMLAHKTNSYRALDKFVRKCAGAKQYVNWSHRAFPSQRTIRFMEMEYNLPLEKFEEVFEEMKFAIHKHKFQTLFPIEIRFVKGDELWLSPAYKRDSVYFAVHTYIKEDFKTYFTEIEKIFKRHGGRPHWGKWHSMTRSEFENVYSKWNDFLKIRSEFDPKELWLNDYLRTILI